MHTKLSAIMAAIVLCATHIGFAQTDRYVHPTDPTCGGNSPCYTAIQDAVDASDPDDTIHLFAATYALNAQLQIDRSLTLRGVSANDTLVEFGPSVAVAVRVTADDVTIEKLHLKSQASSTSGDTHVIDIPFKAWADPLEVYTGFTLSDSIIEGARRSLWLHGADMTIDGNQFWYDGNRCVIQLRAAQGTTSITGNTFEGVIGARQAIILEAGGASTFWWGDLDVSGNTAESFNQFMLVNMFGQASGTTLSITGNTIDHAGNSGSTVIFVPAGDFGDFDDIIIEGNDVTNTHDERLFVYLDYFGAPTEPDPGQIKVCGNTLDFPSTWGKPTDTVHPAIPVGFSASAPTGMTVDVFDAVCPPDPQLVLVSDESCYDAGVGDTVTVSVELLGDGVNEIVGGQFFLEYDDGVLAFVSADPGGAPFDIEVYACSPLSAAIGNCTPTSGLIDYAVGVTGGGPGTAGDATMAVLTFQALAEVCDVADLVTFRPHNPPTRITDADGSPIEPDLVDLDAITIDGTPPVLTLPPNVVVECDQSTDPADTGTATATDNCDPAPVVTYSDVITPGTCAAEYTITRTWTATDACGNQASADQTISVVDTTPPVIHNVPSDITVPADAGTCEAVVTWTPPFATDNCSASVYPANVGSGELTTSGGWGTFLSHAPAGVDYQVSPLDLTTFGGGAPVALRGYMDLSDVHMPGTGEWSDYYAKIRIQDAPGWMAGNALELVFATDWLGGWVGIPPQPWDRIRLENNMSLPQPQQHYNTQGGNTDQGGCAGDPIYPSDRRYYFQLIADPAAATFTLQVYAKGSSVGGSCAWQALVDDPQWLEIASISAPAFDFSSVQGWIGIWGAGAGTSTAAFEALHWGDPVTYGDPPDEISVSSTHAPGDTFPVGTTTVTYTFTDACGNFDQASFDVTVDPVNELVVDLELEGVFESVLTRCITFELFDCPNGTPVIVEQEVTFTSPGSPVSATATGVVVDVPCGVYSCVTARDRLHTLRRTLDDPDFEIDGTQYVADFIFANKPLIGGNLNDDEWIDILDFGIFVGQFGANYGTGDTTCATAAPHADISGDGLVSSADFTFIQTNFLDQAEANCCGGPEMLIASSAVLVGDVNGDGVVDARDLALVKSQLFKPVTAENAWADVNGDGVITAADLAVVKANLFRAAPAVPAEDGPIERISVEELEARGLGHLIQADLNGDGWLDQQDVAAFLQGARP